MAKFCMENTHKYVDPIIRLTSAVYLIMVFGGNRSLP